MQLGKNKKNKRTNREVPSTAWQVKADSTKATWFSVRRNEKWQWRPCDPLKDLKATLGAGLVRVTFRASGKDVDREKLQAWLESFLSKEF